MPEIWDYSPSAPDGITENEISGKLTCCSDLSRSIRPRRQKVAMTLKQELYALEHQPGKGFSTEPLSCGLYLNTVFGNQFWVSEPERYRKDTMVFQARCVSMCFMGQRLTYDIDPNRRFLAKSVTFFYEISTCDLYLISGVTNSYLRPRDYLSLSFGLKFQWL